MSWSRAGPLAALAAWSGGGRERPLAVLAAVVLGWTAALLAPRDFPVGTFADDAQYAVLAKSLRERQAYRVLNLPGEPAETKYPPGYPALLALAWSPERGDAENLERLRWVNLMLLGPVAGVLALAAMRLVGVPPFAGAALALAGVMAPRMMGFWTVPMSEPLFLGLVAAGLVLLASGRDALAVAALVLAVYVRVLALPFLVVALADLARRDLRRVRAPVAVAALALLPWGVWTLWHGGAVPAALGNVYGSYARWYLDCLRADWTTVLLVVPLKNALIALRALGGAVGWWGWIPGVLPGLLGAVLIWRCWEGRRVRPVLAAGLALYAALILLWPFPSDRFVEAVWPLTLILVAASWRKGALAVAAAALLVGAVGLARGEGVRSQRERGRSWAATRAAVAPLIPRGAVVAAGNPALYYLSLGTATVPSRRMRTYRWYRMGYWASAWGLGDDLWAIVSRYGVTHVVVERGVEGRYAAGSLMRQCPAALSTVWESGGGLLLAVDPGASCAPEPVPR